MFRNTYVQINGDILKENVRKLTSAYKEYKYHIGVVKANCYGHGIRAVEYLIEGGINYLAAATLKECLELRSLYEEIPILCLEPIAITYLNVCLENNITITVHDYAYFKELMNCNLNNLKIHVKIDSGMNRLGIKKKTEVTEVVTTLTNAGSLEGIYTHFATSGILDKHFDNQLKTFLELTSDIELTNIPIVHLGRSLTLLKKEKFSFCNAVRMGIVMYGFDYRERKSGWRYKIRTIKTNIIKKIKNISQTSDSKVNLDTAFSLFSEIIQIKEVKKGEYIGYSAAYKAKEDMKIAVIPIGYGDGLPYLIKEVSINQKRYPVVSTICMDMLMVKIDDTVSINDKVVFCGDDLPIKVVTAQLGSNAYRFLTSINNRVPRVYITNKNKS